ncbi:auxin-responsive protein IAA29-like isoform X1 [Hibiscus syriacus]|uniref:auxin-responsive protein IAA29-like isoform X1 n=1 Tax=Hibiscus syriacus TaxID=106335 RepID=UPI001920C1F0|nr:auxin-responsive protein IAA29-like isoform X1 [Hibiscus syriacus]
MPNMELQLGLVLPTPNIIKGLDLNNLGLDQLKQTGGFSDKSKRSFEQAFGNFKQECNTKTLLLWSGQPNEEEDHKDQKNTTFSTIDDRNDEEEVDQVVGWPPIKTWRKKIFQQQNGVGGIENNRVADKENGRSIYVKAKMEGVAITRKVDIRVYLSYQTLTNSLITMFAEDKKCADDDYTRYILTYQDKEGDWLIAGDIPWQSFIRSVQRLKIIRNRD